MFFRSSAIVSMLLILVAGCGGSRADLGEVKGRVTMDGQPLPEALVRFVPESGRSAQGITNANGEYRLDYSASDEGALVGKSKVQITTGSLEDTSGKSEKVPQKYNRESELTADVVSGSNVINFELQSK